MCLCANPQTLPRENIDMVNSCIASLAWEVALIIALQEFIRFLQSTLCFQQRQSPYWQQNYLVLGVARLGNTWSWIGGFMHLCCCYSLAGKDYLLYVWSSLMLA